MFCISYVKTADFYCDFSHVQGFILPSFALSFNFDRLVFTFLEVGLVKSNKYKPITFKLPRKITLKKWADARKKHINKICQSFHSQL